MNGVPILSSAETGSYLSINEFLTVILVSAAYVITVIGTVHLSSWLHKQMLKIR